MGVGRLSHIGVVVNDLEAAVTKWTEGLGFTVTSRGEVAVEGIRNALLAPPGAEAGSFFIELMEPYDKSDKNNAIARRLATAGEGFYHLAYRVSDIANETTNLEASEIRTVPLPELSEGAPGRLVVHPKSANGILIEILEDR